MKRKQSAEWCLQNKSTLKPTLLLLVIVSKTVSSRNKSRPSRISQKKFIGLFLVRPFICEGKNLFFDISQCASGKTGVYFPCLKHYYNSDLFPKSPLMAQIPDSDPSGNMLARVRWGLSFLFVISFLKFSSGVEGKPKDSSQKWNDV